MQEAVLDLVGEERAQTLGSSDSGRFGQQFGVEVGAAHLAYLALVDESVHNGHRVPDRHLRVWPVQLVQVDVVGAELIEAAFDSLPDVCRRAAAGVRNPRDGHSKLGGDDDLVAAMAEGRPEKQLGLSVAVVVRSVEDIDSAIEGLIDHGLAPT